MINSTDRTHNLWLLWAKSLCLTNYMQTKWTIINFVLIMLTLHIVIVIFQYPKINDDIFWSPLHFHRTTLLRSPIVTKYILLLFSFVFLRKVHCKWKIRVKQGESFFLSFYNHNHLGITNGDCVLTEWYLLIKVAQTEGWKRNISSAQQCDIVTAFHSCPIHKIILYAFTLRTSSVNTKHIKW